MSCTMISQQLIIVCFLLVLAKSKGKQIVSHGASPPAFRFPLQLCEGDCDKDSDCDDGLICFQKGSNTRVPGCEGGDSDNSRTDYCIYKEEERPFTTPSTPPPQEPTSATKPTPPPISNPNPSSGFSPELVSFGGSPPAFRFPLGLCQGDCDSDKDCQNGLVCYQRDGNQNQVPGCTGEDNSKTDYCIYPVNNYSPGKLSVSKLGLNLSEGLDARLIARSGKPVEYKSGKRSGSIFHDNPDAGATFPDTRSNNVGGWIYVSNSEVDNGGGGVGAITFDKTGNVIDYQILLKGTSMNCGGGRTPWKTWVSCEEEGSTGQIYQVHPTGEREPQVMTLGNDGGRWESFAYDIRDKEKPRFFVTEDDSSGALRRFTPDDPDWNEPWDMLHGNGKVEYLMLHPIGNKENGQFSWTDNKGAARENARAHYPFSEGIDVNGHELFFVCKKVKMLFTLNLDTLTYTRKSTLYGLFDGAPDQIERVLEGESELLYFTEEGGENAGVHARDSKSRFLTILESPVYDDETTGLSFSPDSKFMYVAYQFTGLLFQIWRRDGATFHEKQLNVKSHHSEF